MNKDQDLLLERQVLKMAYAYARTWKEWRKEKKRDSLAFAEYRLLQLARKLRVK